MTTNQTATNMTGDLTAKLLSLGAATQVACADPLVLDMSTSHYEVTGITGTPVAAITGTGATEGNLLFLRFAAAPTITDGGTLILNGDFVAAADECLVLINNGGGTGSWTELGRSTA